MKGTAKTGREPAAAAADRPVEEDAILHAKLLLPFITRNYILK